MKIKIINANSEVLHEGEEYIVTSKVDNETGGYVMNLYGKLTTIIEYIGDYEGWHCDDSDFEIIEN